jgi:hypothetical protein
MTVHTWGMRREGAGVIDRPDTGERGRLVTASETVVNSARHLDDDDLAASVSQVAGWVGRRPA